MPNVSKTYVVVCVVAIKQPEIAAKIAVKRSGMDTGRPGVAVGQSKWQ
jgi:hypothetical protein